MEKTTISVQELSAQMGISLPKAYELSGFLFELSELDLLDTEWKDSRFRAIVERITVHNDGRLMLTFTNGSEETVMM